MDLQLPESWGRYVCATQIQRRERLETLEIVRQAPRQIPVGANDVVRRRGDDEADHATASDRDRGLDVRVRLVVENLEVVVFVIEDAWRPTLNRERR